jgi:glycosyltransferase involved in cell wall biosynthesis
MSVPEPRGSGRRRPRVLMIATKRPWPPVGGGNVAVHQMAEAVARAGADVHLLFPAPPGATGPAASSGQGDPRRPAYALHEVCWAPHPLWRAAHHLVLPPPLSLARYRGDDLRRLLVETARRLAPDIVHLEQLHLSWLAPALGRALGPIPVVLRQQNVESQVLSRLAAFQRPLRRLLLAREARRMARAEARACTEVASVAAISGRDAERLRALAPGADIRAILPAFTAPADLPEPLRLEGGPPLVCLGSFDWLPGRDGGAWLVRQVWPLLRERCPGVVLHLAGPGSETLAREAPDDPRIRVHGVLDSPWRIYDPRALALVPVRAGSGVRLRILESWAAGVPVVTTPVGGEGLVVSDGEGARVAADAAGFATAVAELVAAPGVARRLIATGHRLLGQHEPGRIARQVLDWYADALAVGAHSPHPGREGARQAPRP